MSRVIELLLLGAQLDPTEVEQVKQASKRTKNVLRVAGKAPHGEVEQTQSNVVPRLLVVLQHVAFDRPPAKRDLASALGVSADPHLLVFSAARAHALHAELGLFRCSRRRRRRCGRCPLPLLCKRAPALNLAFLAHELALHPRSELCRRLVA